MHITSTSNPVIKQTARLYDAAERAATGLFLIEGVRELDLALKNKIVLEQLFHCPEIINEVPVVTCPITTVSKAVFEKLTIRGSTGGFLAVAHQPKNSLKELQLSKDPLVLVLEQLEKPGNIGAILRTANAAGVNAVLVCDEVTDLYNPNTVRASLGAIFATPTVSCTAAEARAYLAKNNVTVVATTPHTKQKYTDIDYRQATAIAIGSEKAGLTAAWLKDSVPVLIPMSGAVDSLNASTSAAILIYEAIRQRS